MRMREKLFWLFTLLLLCFQYLGAKEIRAAEIPQLASFITNENKEIYVGIFQQVGLELQGCKNKKEALQVLNLPSRTSVLATTLSHLEEKYSLGLHPKLPCSREVMERMQNDWPMDQALYADMEETRRYYLEQKPRNGIFYSIPSQCMTWKDIFNIRERIATPGVLRGESRPMSQVMREEIPLSCGQGEGTSGPGPGPAPDPTGEGNGEIRENSWALYYAETYLSEFGDADFVYVLVQQRRDMNQGTSSPASYKKYYLPIYKVDGRKTTEYLWDPTSEETQLIEKKLKEIFRVEGGLHSPVQELPFQEMDQLTLYPFMEICLFKCGERGSASQLEHAYFPDSSSTELVKVESTHPVLQTNIHGEREWIWNYGKSKNQFLSFIGCSTLGQYFGMSMVDPLPSRGQQSHLQEMEKAVLHQQRIQEGGVAFRCQLPPDQICKRKIQHGEVLGPEHFRPSGDCLQKNKKILQLHIQGTVLIKKPLTLFYDHQGEGEKSFSVIELIGDGSSPTGSDQRSRVMVQIKDRLEHPASECLFEKRPYLFFVKNLENFKIRNVEFMVGEDSLNTHGRLWLGLHGESSQIILENTLWGAADPAAGMDQWDRNLRFCKSSLFSVNNLFRAKTLNIQGMQSFFLLYGYDKAQSQLISTDSAVILQSKSALRFHQTHLEGQKVIQLKDSLLQGSRSWLQSYKGPSSRAQCLRLSGESEVSFKYSAAKNFERVALFLDGLAKVKFILPTHDLKLDNEHLYWGEGKFEIVE